MGENKSEGILLILGNANKRFSGVTSTMLQVLSRQEKLTQVAVLGKHFLPEHIQAMNFFALARLCYKPLPNGQWRVFHARRNDEMIQALLLKWVFRAKLKIAFTSTAQRHHSRFTKFLMRQMDSIISTCSAAASYLETPPDIIIPHGIDTHTFHPAENREDCWRELGLPGRYGIGILGRIRPQKGLDRLIDAVIPLLPNHPDFTVVITGQIQRQDQAYFDQQMQKIKQAGLEKQVHYLGELPFSDIPKVIRSMTLVAALSRNEGFGLTVIEAMASGAAVIASDAGAWPDIIRQGIDGYSVSGSQQAINSTLKTLLDSPQLLLEMGAKARQHAEQHYSIDREARQLTDHLLSLQ